MKALFLYISLLFSLLSTAQEPQLSVNEIREELKKELPDSLRVHYLFDLGEHLGEQNFSESKTIHLNALDILQTMKPTHDVLMKTALAYDKLGIIERKTSNYELAFSYYLKALKIKEKIGDSINIGRSYHNIGMLFRFQNEYEKSRTYLRKAITLRRSLRDSSKLATSLNMYGVIMAKLKKYDSALYYYDNAKKLYTDDMDVTLVNANIASLYNRMEAYEKAQQICQDNVAIYRNHDSPYKLCKALRSLGFVNRKLNRLDDALKTLNEAKQIAETHGYKVHLKYIYLQLYRITRDQGNFKDAMNHVRTYNKYKDSVEDIETVKRITALELNYKHQKEKLADSIQFINDKKEIELRVASERAKNNLYVALLILAITIITSLFLWFSYRKKAVQSQLNKQKLEKELLAERMKNTKFQSQKVMADKAMRLQFTEEFSNKINKILKGSAEKNNPDLQMLLTELQSQMKTEKRLEILEKNHSNTDIDFEKQLVEHFPTLTKSEREICALMRLNLSLKEIMSIRNVSMNSIKSSRYRIRKKMSISKGIELEYFIQNLFS